jgi:hypothetical protein
MTERLSSEYLNRSISHATMVSDHIAEAIEDFAKEINDLDLIALVEEYFELETEAERSEFLNETLWNYMDEIAPEGSSFVSHPGDGSDYGFWEYDEEDDDEYDL